MTLKELNQISTVSHMSLCSLWSRLLAHDRVMYSTEQLDPI